MRKIAQIIRGLAVPDSIRAWAFGQPVNYEKSDRAGIAHHLVCAKPTQERRVKRALLLHRLKACATNLFQGSALLATAFSEKARNHR